MKNSNVLNGNLTATSQGLLPFHKYSMKQLFLRLPLVLFLLAGLSCSDNDSENNEDTPAQNSVASFSLSGDGYNETISYNGEDNLIFCRLTGSEMWIRMARDKAANGNGSRYIDIDICNYAGSGTYAPVDPRNRPCPEGLLWDIFWHDGDKVYSNTDTSSPCQLVLKLNGDVLSGTFNCSEVIRFEGTESIQVTEGSFSCVIE